MFFLNTNKKIIDQLTLTKLVSSATTAFNYRLKDSYNISLMFSNSGKPHTTDGELFIPVISEVLCTVLHKQACDII